MRNVGVLLALLMGLVSTAAAQVRAPQGFVTDRAGVIDPAIAAKLTRLLEELKEKTGAEIAVLTVDSTAPLDDFSYAMRVAEVWKPGKKGEDTGVLVLVAVKDRKIRVLVGYGLEGILPDGLVGQIQDREMLPDFRAGKISDGIWRGVVALANRIAADRGVVLTGVPPPRAAPRGQPPIPTWVVLLIVVAFMLLAARGGVGPYRRRRGPMIFPGGSRGGDGGGFGGFGGGGWGFGGFGGGCFGGGGAGRSW